MRYGVAISALLHLGILILVVVGLPGLLQSERAEIVPISVEVVSLEELSKKPEKKSPPKPKAKKPPPKKPEPKVAKKPPPPPAAPTPPPPETLKIPEPEPMPPEAKLEPKPKPAAPKAEPLPTPKPKPKPKVKKPDPPKKAETRVAIKTPPAPRPKRKPKPPPPKPDAFQSLLKNLAQDRRKAEKAKAAEPVKVAKQADDEPKRSALQARMMAASLVQAVNRQVTPCWSIPAGAKDAANMSVAILIRLNPDGSLGGVPKVEDTGRLGRDPFFRAVAESSLRALRNPQCMPLKLPYDQYDLWKEITFVFDPKEALGQ
jgi:hypothetical protein